MYYDLSQKEYREYSRKFKKTFIGKSRYRDFLGCSLIGTYFLILFVIYMVTGIVKKTNYELNYNNLSLIVLTLLFMALEIVTRVLYDYALKEYIESQKNK